MCGQNEPKRQHGNHGSRRCASNGSRWSDHLDHGSSRLNEFHHHRRDIDHGCRRTHRRKGWQEFHHFYGLRKLHMANGSSSQTNGSLSNSSRLAVWNLEDFLDDLHLRNLHDLDVRHIWNRRLPRSEITGAGATCLSVRAGAACTVTVGGGARITFSTTRTGAG